MGKFIGLLLVVLLSLAIAPSAEASSFCRTLNDHVICIVEIKRSAKYYWEYRASVSIDGVEKPVEIYNCRDRTRIGKEGIPVKFEPNGAGELICKMLGGFRQGF